MKPWSVNRGPWIVAALVLALSLTQAHGLQPVGVSDHAQDFVFLAEARPLLIRVHARIDGQSLQAAHDDFLKYLFRHLDINGDGVLSKEEAARAPTLESILSGVPGGGFGGFGMGGLGVTAPTMAELDADGDGKVTPAELATYYRNKGLVSFQFQAATAGGNPFTAFIGGGKSEPSVKAVSEAIFALLDKDGDGKLTKAELAAAPAALLALDADDDEIVTARELVPASKAPGSGMAGAAMMMGAAGKNSSGIGERMVLMVTTRGVAPANLASRLQERYGSKDSTKLSRKALGMDKATFNALDANRDGVLDATELANFVKRPPDLELVVRIGTREDGEARVEVVTAKGQPAPLAGKVRMLDGVALLDLGVTRAEVRGTEEYRTDRLGGVLRQQYGSQFTQADKDRNGFVDEEESKKVAFFRGTFKAMDRDGDGKVSEKEFYAYLDSLQQLQKRARAACVTLVVTDESRGLFDLLDVNRDGKLSVREMRGAVELLGKFAGDKGYLTRTDLPHSYRLTVKSGPANKGGLDPLAAFEELYGGSGSADAHEGPAAGPAWFRKMDRNRDGDVSRREWLGSEELFRRIDTDGDGLISAEEANRYDALHRKQK
ncbi:MAG TPA: EF-hand domain-containing protein [Gemmataceae bacterium]|nr:EF-hand domain-containing protein [Gemmataceae bacterium]